MDWTYGLEVFSLRGQLLDTTLGLTPNSQLADDERKERHKRLQRLHGRLRRLRGQGVQGLSRFEC